MIGYKNLSTDQMPENEAVRDLVSLEKRGKSYGFHKIAVRFDF